MKISVVVPTFRRPELLSRCLDGLVRQRFEADDFEIIVADDGNDGPTRFAVGSARSSPTIRYLPVIERHGPAAARNVGWRAARGEIIAFTDDDCIPDTSWLAAGSAPFIDQTVIAVTGQTVVPISAAPTDFERDAAGLERAEFITANCFVRKTVLEALGGFDEDFELAWREDSDLHFRLLDSGGKIVSNPRAVVIHPVRTAPWGVSLWQQRKVHFDALLYRKHPLRFRERITPQCPWDYYLIALSLPLSAFFYLNRQSIFAAAALTLWGVLMGGFLWRRLSRSTWSPQHVAEMLVTSLLIPFLSIFWRLYGAVRFRVLFW